MYYSVQVQSNQKKKAQRDKIISLLHKKNFHRGFGGLEACVSPVHLQVVNHNYNVTGNRATKAHTYCQKGFRDFEINSRTLCLA